MALLRFLLCFLLTAAFGIAAANNETSDDGFIWIDANTRIKIKPISTVKPSPAATGATAPEKKTEKKEKPKK
jgi:hypothetical protein